MAGQSVVWHSAVWPWSCKDAHTNCTAEFVTCTCNIRHCAAAYKLAQHAVCCISCLFLQHVYMYVCCTYVVHKYTKKAYVLAQLATVEYK